MKRPMIAAAICLAIASAVGTRTELLRGVWPAVWLVVIGGAVLIGSFHKNLVKMIPYIALTAAALLYVVGYQRVVVQPVQTLVKQNVLTVRATVLNFPETYEENQRVSLLVTAAGKDVPEKRRAFKTYGYLPFTNQSLEPGDVIETRVSFYQPDIWDGFERQSYYAANGYFVLAACPEEAEVLHEQGKAVWWSYPLRLAQELKQSVIRQLPERQAGLLNAVLFGDRSGMFEADSRGLRKSGLSHMAAVSGMHVGFLSIFFYIVFGRKFGSILSIPAVICFVFMAGASPSVIRAAVMYLIMTVSFLRFEESEALNSLAIALTLLLLLNPYAISSASMLLSFGATLGLLLFSGRLHRLLIQPFAKQGGIVRRFAGTVISAVSCSICAMIFTTPILLAMFGYVTVLSPLANLLTLAVVGLVFALGLVLSICGLFLPSGFAPLTAIEGRLLLYILDVSDLVSHLPFGVLSWGDLVGKAAVFGFYVGLSLLFLLPQKRRGYWVLIPMSILLAGCSLWSAKDLRESTRLTILPSGAGQTMIYSSGQAAVTVIDCGGDKAHDSAEAVVEFLDWNCFEAVDPLILTAVDLAHARYAEKLLRTGYVRSLIFPKIPKSKQNELYERLIAAAKEHRVYWREGLPAVVPENICLEDDIERKLVVNLSLGGRQVLSLHSLTQNMTAEYLKENPVKADILLLSENNIEDADMLRDVLETIDPKDIILECGYIDNESLLRRPCHNTKLEGEIVLREKKGDGVQWQ